MDWPTLITATATATGASGILAALIQIYFKFKTDAELKRIEAGYTKEIKRLESQLGRKDKVFAKTEEAVGVIYKNLLELKQAADHVTAHGEKAAEIAAEKYNKAFDVFNSHYQPNKIYLPEKILHSIEVFYRTVEAARLQYMMAIAEAKSPYRDMSNSGTLFKSFFETSEMIPKLLESMHAEFQKVLGVSDEIEEG